jgi:hypothetical protein
MNWHADTALLERYAQGTLDDANAYSVEAHLLGCDDCRALLPREQERLDTIWTSVHASLHAPRTGPIEWMLRHLGVADHVARVLAATPSLSLSWLSAVATALLFTVLASHAGQGTPLPFLMVAPMLPLAGVAAAYGPGVDPTYEMGAATPMRGLRLLLIRSIAVFTATAVLIGIGSFGLPRVDWTDALWILPALGMTSASLALCTWFPPVRSALIVGASWILVAIIGLSGATRPITPHTIGWFTSAGQVALAAVAILGIVVVVMRSELFERVTD